MTKSELEQELQIVEAELDQVKKTNYDQARELEMLRGKVAAIESAASSAGVSLALVPSTPEEADRQALDHVRTGINQDLQALDELRNPQPLPEPSETNLDIVRANQRERAELQQRLARANNTLARIASALRFDRWDESADQIVERVNQIGTFTARIYRKIESLRKHPIPSPIAISTLEWVLDDNRTIQNADPVVDVTKPRLINFVVNGHDTPVEAKPEHSLHYLLELALVRANCTQPADQWQLYAESGERLRTDLIAREVKASRVVVTLPIGAGA